MNKYVFPLSIFYCPSQQLITRNEKFSDVREWKPRLEKKAEAKCNKTYFELSMLKADSSDSIGMKDILERDELDDGGSKCCDMLITAMMKLSDGDW